MAGGQQIAISQGTLTPGKSAALALFESIRTETGLVTANNNDDVALLGTPVALSTGFVFPTYSRALSGSEITGTAGTLTLVINPSTSGGQVIASGIGTLSAAGDNVTVNISGEEITFGTGLVDSGGQALLGEVAICSTGSVARSIDRALSGMAITSATGVVGAVQDADDTFIQSGIGNALVDMQIPLVGHDIYSLAGIIVPTGDVTVALAGEEVSVDDGTLGYERAFPITGQQINVAQESIGAPGGATLSGLEIAATAGTIFTTDDRDYALTGSQITASTGQALVSSLAFVTGQEIVISAQEIGPRVVDLVGQQINVQQGFVRAPSRGTVEGGIAVKPGRARKKYLVEIDNEQFWVDSVEEAQQLLEAAAEMAAQAAKEQANAVVQRRFTIAKASDRPLDVSPVTLDLPNVTSDDEVLQTQLRKVIGQAYQRAEVEAEIAVRLAKQRLEDEEDNVILMLLNE